MGDDADDLERLIRKGIRRVRLEDDAHACTLAAQQPTHSTVLHTTVSHTVVSHASARGPEGKPAYGHASTQRSTYTAPQLRKPAPLAQSTRASMSPASGHDYLKILLALVGSAVIYFIPITIRTLFFDHDTEVSYYQYLLSTLYFLFLLETRYLSRPQNPTTYPHVQKCDVITLLKMERENLQRHMSVSLDRQYSFYHYPHFHIPLSTILSDIDAINQELLQVELLILKLETGKFEKAYDPILGKVLSKYGVSV